MVRTKAMTEQARKRIRHLAAVKSWDTRGRKKKERPGPESSRSDWKAGGGAKGGEPVAGGAGAKMSEAIASEMRTKVKDPWMPDVEKDEDHDGVTDTARVGVPGKVVPPPPKVPRLPNLDAVERKAETEFADAFEKDPDGMAKRYLESIRSSDSPNKFETDAAKNLYAAWKGEGMSVEARAQVRSTLNTPLHQTANAIAKRAFLMHLDSMSDAEKAKGMLVTVGGCGAGKGFALKTLSKSGMPEFDAKGYGAVWDSAGDQNATENPWLLEEAKRRGVKVTFAYVSADPQVSWAHEKRGVVARAKGTNDGRMVDATVFADSYVIGARNHAAFAKKHASEANFVYVQNGDNIHRLDSVPLDDINRNRSILRDFAIDRVAELAEDIPARIRRGATVGQRIWGD